METKTLLTGIICFIAGALLVSTAATTFDKKETETIAMNVMVQSLQNKTGDDFDKAFIEQMIMHHEGAIAMAKLSASQAKHEEIKTLSKNILTAQQQEIDEMKRWQQHWNYERTDTESSH